MVCVTVVKIKRLLDGLLFRDQIQLLQTLDLYSVIDSLIFEEAGQSFLTNSWNDWIQAGAGRVIKLAWPSIWDKIRGYWR